MSTADPSRLQDTNKARDRFRWPPDVREQAVALAAEVGATEAARRVGASRRTVVRWCQDAGVSHTTPDAQDRTHTARSVLAARVAEAKLDRLAALEDTLTAAQLALMDRLAVEADLAARIADTPDPAAAVKWEATTNGPTATPTDPDLRARLALMGFMQSTGAPLRDLEGVVTRTIHDMQLLAGAATERGTVTVEWGAITRPDVATDVEPVTVPADPT